MEVLRRIVCLGDTSIHAKRKDHGCLLNYSVVQQVCQPVQIDGENSTSFIIIKKYPNILMWTLWLVRMVPSNMYSIDFAVYYKETGQFYS